MGGLTIEKLYAREEVSKGVVVTTHLVAFDFTRFTGRCGLIICGDRDKCCPLRSLKKIAQELGGRL